MANSTELVYPLIVVFVGNNPLVKLQLLLPHILKIQFFIVYGSPPLLLYSKLKGCVCYIFASLFLDLNTNNPKISNNMTYKTTPSLNEATKC